MVYLLCFTLFMIGLYGVLVKKNIIKIVLGLVIIEYAIHLFLILLGYRSDGLPPIMEIGQNEALFQSVAVDPLPQAIVLTAIVIGLGTLALMVGLCMRIYEQHGTFDISKIRRLKG